jgi:hypothetical protein
MEGIEIKVQPNNWIMFGGQELILNNGERDLWLEEGYIRHKEGSENGEMEFTEKTFKKDLPTK